MGEKLEIILTKAGSPENVTDHNFFVARMINGPHWTPRVRNSMIASSW